MMRIVDTKGQLCPAPLIAAKKALKETPKGESFVLLTDNKTSFDNLTRFLKDNKAETQFIESLGTWTITITNTIGEIVKPNAEEYCTPEIAHFEKGDFVVVISSDKMGEGDEKLGYLLMTTFINSLKDLDKMPQKILFYNNGVKMVTKSSPVIQTLRDLENMGIELMACGTCVNHYELSAEIGAGVISNMYTIAEAMALSGKILKP
jgi:selenium metabolism protein YedF